jgi:hypothetical protein
MDFFLRRGKNKAKYPSWKTFLGYLILFIKFFRKGIEGGLKKPDFHSGRAKK